MRRQIELDPRDLSPDDRHLLNAHGPGRYIIGGYFPAIPPLSRERAIEDATKRLEAAPPEELEGLTLCGVTHSEDLEVWQLPHTARPIVRRKARALERLLQNRVQLIRCWQHLGPCPEAAPCED